MNDHDLEAFLACIHPDYKSEQPTHPERGFGGRDQVHKNWAAMFEEMPDFEAEVLATAQEANTVWTEWRWNGTRGDATRLRLRGVTLFTVEGDQIVAGRLYMEEVAEGGDDIDRAIDRLSGRAD